MGHRSLPLLLLNVREAAMKHFRPILRHYGLTDQQWRVMRVLSLNPEGMEAGRLAHDATLLSPSLTGIVARLSDMGYVCRQWSEVDQRRQSIRLTAQGCALIAEIGVVLEKQYELIEAELGAGTLDSVYTTLDLALEILQQPIPSALPAEGGARPASRTPRARRSTR